MADIRIKDLPLATGGTAPTGADAIAIDGLTTRKTTISAIGDVAVPVASQSEAEVGVNASKRMTPLTTKQSIASEVGVTIASAAQGALANTALQPEDVGSAAFQSSSAFATADQGAKADSAVQPANVPALVSLADFSANVAIPGRDYSLPVGFGAGTALAINTIMEQIANRGGGVVILPPSPAIFLDATIDNKYSQVMLQGSSDHEWHGDGIPTGNPAYNPHHGTFLIPTFAGTVLKHRTPYNGPLYAANRGGGFKDFSVKGNSIATRLLEVDSTIYGTYHLSLTDAVGAEAALFTCARDGVDLGGSGWTQRMSVDLYVRQLEAGAASNAHCVVFRGSTTANVSINDDITLDLQHRNGDGLVLENADGNIIWQRDYVVPGGTGRCVRSKAAVDENTSSRDNFWKFLSANTRPYFEGTEANIYPSKGHRILVTDMGNGTPAPELGPGASCVEDAVTRSYTPTVTALSGAAVNVTVTPHRYETNGHICTIRGGIQIVDKGTAAVLIYVSLPIAANTNVAPGELHGSSLLAGVSIHGNVDTPNNRAAIRLYNAGDPWVNGAVYRYEISYEVN